MSNNLHAVASFPARRTAPQSPPTWSDGRDAIRAAVKELCKRYPKAVADEHRIGQLLAERLGADDDLLQAAAVVLAHDSLTADQARQHQRQSGVGHKERKAVMETTAKKLATKARTQAVLDMVVNGRALRFMTGGEVGRLGAGFSKLAERVPADAYVGEVVTEAEAAALMGTP
jgi:hypothetical protein